MVRDISSTYTLSEKIKKYNQCESFMSGIVVLDLVDIDIETRDGGTIIIDRYNKFGVDVELFEAGEPCVDVDKNTITTTLLFRILTEEENPKLSIESLIAINKVILAINKKGLVIENDYSEITNSVLRLKSKSNLLSETVRFIPFTKQFIIAAKSPTALSTIKGWFNF